MLSLIGSRNVTNKYLTTECPRRVNGSEGAKVNDKGYEQVNTREKRLRRRTLVAIQQQIGDELRACVLDVELDRLRLILIWREIYVLFANFSNIRLISVPHLNVNLWNMNGNVISIFACYGECHVHREKRQPLATL
jgi:hypothetical protein